MNRLGLGLLVLGGVLSAIACGGDDDPSNPAATGSSGSAGAAGSADASGGSAGNSGESAGAPGDRGGTAGASDGGNAGAGGSPEGGAGGTAEGFESNPPGAVLDQVITDGEPGLLLLNSNVKQTTAGASTLVEWFAEVRNDGETIACYPRAYLKMYDADDAVVWQTGELGSFADTKPYQVADDGIGTVPCLSPGEIGVFFSNEARETPAALNTITRVHVELSSEEYEGTVLHPDPPVFANLMVSEFLPDSDAWLVEGDLTAATAMDLASIDVYQRNPATGLYDGWRHATSLDVLADGETWHFETNNGEETFTDLSPFVKWYYP